jgi:Helix-turn-helix domain
MAGMPDDMLDVRRAAVLAGRHPETVRRWVWTGRLAAQRQGNRLLVARGDLEALIEDADRRSRNLAEWASQAHEARSKRAERGSGRSGADLVLDDRKRRSGAGR